MINTTPVELIWALVTALIGMVGLSTAMIGYFLANEPLWAFGDNNIASEMLATSTASATRAALVEWLEKKYHQDIHLLSKAWRKEFPSFDALRSDAILNAEKLSPEAENDLDQFSLLMVDEYLRLPTQALRRLDPHHLNLGIRFGGSPAPAIQRMGRITYWTIGLPSASMAGAKRVRMVVIRHAVVSSSTSPDD